MGTLRLSLLGTPVMEHAGAFVTPATRKATALLIYLAVEGGLHSREKLVALLWPESDDEHGRGALRSTLTFLRAALGERDGHAGQRHLLVARDRLGFDQTGAELDVALLRDAYAGATARAPVSAVIPLLRAAADRYGGDFLEGFSLVDAPGFDEWAGDQREALRRRMDAVHDRLSHTLAERGELAAAREAAARWVAFDRLNEAAHRRLIGAHIAAGDRAAAVRAYQACRTVLDDELGAEPAPETKALGEHARLGSLPPTEQAPAADGLAMITMEGPLVGRAEEHARLAGVYREARRGRTALASVEGEPGIGKSRLAAAFSRWASGQGALVLQGRAFEAGGRLPYQPVVDALRGALPLTPAQAKALGETWLAELSRLLPELREQLPSLPRPLSGEEEARNRLFEAVVRLGRVLCAARPLVLVLDDSQWAGEATLALVAYAMRRWSEADAAVLTVCCFRDEELRSSPALGAWLNSAGRDTTLHRVPLGALSAPDTLRLFRSLGGETAQPGGEAEREAALEQLGMRLYDETGGQPLFVTETVKGLVERGLLTAAPGGGWVVAADTPADAGAFLPPGVQDAIRSRLLRLNAGALLLLVAAAVLDEGSSLEQLCAVAALDDGEALDALDGLLARRLLREAGGRYLFTHDKIREVAYQDAGPARRRVFHRRAFEGRSHDGAAAAELARHAVAAGLLPEAFRYSVAAGDEAMRLFAVRDAIAHYERAWELTASSDRQAGDEPSLRTLHLQLGRAYELENRYADAAAQYNAVLRLARTGHDRATECEALNRLTVLAAHNGPDLVRMSSLLDEALDAARDSGDGSSLVETEWNLSRLAVFRSDLTAAFAHSLRSLELARQHGLTERVARTLNWLALTETMIGSFDAGAAHAREACDLYATLGDRAMEADSLGHLAGNLVRAGRPVEAIAAARSGLAISTAIENAWGQAAAQMHLALGLCDVAAYAEALAAAQSGLAAAQISGYPPLILLNRLESGRALRHLGDFERALTELDEAQALAEQLGHRQFSEAVASELCAVQLLRGDFAAALEQANQALAARDYDALFSGHSRYHEVRSLVQAGELEAAAEDVRRFAERTGSNRRYRVPLLRCQAVLAAARGDDEARDTLLAEALALAEEVGLVGEAGEIQAERRAPPS